MANLDATQTSKTQDWLTPLWLFELLDREFDFDLDAAATDENTLCDKWFTAEEDGLKQDWFGNVFLNFPYNRANLWVAKAYNEVVAGKAKTVVLLAASRTDTKWFWEYIRHGEVRLLKGRLKFDHQDGAKYAAPFPSCVCILSKETLQNPKTIYWEVNEKNVHKSEFRI